MTTATEFCYVVKGQKEVKGRVQVPGDPGEAGIIGVYMQSDLYHIGYVSDKKKVLVDAITWDNEKYSPTSDLENAKKLARDFRKDVSDAASDLILD